VVAALAVVAVGVAGCAGGTTTTTVTAASAGASSGGNTGAGAQNTGSGTSDTGSTGGSTGATGSTGSSGTTGSSGSATAADGEGPGSASHAGDAAFCSSHNCIANFANGNGIVVQCADGMWSHSGGLSGACSDHGGESAGGTGSGAVGNSGSQTANTGSAGLPNQCDANVSASSNVTCGFAENTFYEYCRVSGGDSSQSEAVQAWSPTKRQYYSENCSNTGDAVDCTFGGGVVRLTVGGLSVYSSSQASAYAQSHDVGPNG
jgi:hypothetical protein